jgi:hypothetical protein
VGGLIYVPGGMVGTDQVTTTLEAYDPLKDRWTSLRPLPTHLCAYAVAAVGKRIYLFGGWDGKAYLDTVHIYEPVTDTWTLGSPMPVPRAFAGAGVIENKVYVVGGYNEKQEFSVCEEYDPALEGSGESPWRERAPMAVPRGGIAVTVIGDNLFAIGGGWQGGLAYNERYDPHSNAWFRFESPVLGQWRNLGVAAVDVSLYAIGGWSGEYLSTNQEYQALYRIILPISPR